MAAVFHASTGRCSSRARRRSWQSPGERRARHPRRSPARTCISRRRAGRPRAGGSGGRRAVVHREREEIESGPGRHRAFTAFDVTEISRSGPRGTPSAGHMKQARLSPLSGRAHISLVDLPTAILELSLGLLDGVNVVSDLRI